MNDFKQIHARPARAWLSALVAVALLAGARPAAAGFGAGHAAIHAQPAGLAERWAAARDTARRNGWATYWVGWAVRVPASTRVASSNGPGEGDPSRSALEVVGGGSARRLGARPDSADAIFFVRVDGGGAPREMRIRRPDAPMAVGGVPVAWLGVAPDAESLALLGRLLGPAPEAVRREIGAAAALHRDPAAVVAFVRRLLAGEASAPVRAQAAYWLRYQPTAQALALLEEIVRRDASPRVREEAVTAIAQLGTAPARRTLRRLATDSSVPSAARREAGEWLARGAGSR